MFGAWKFNRKFFDAEICSEKMNTWLRTTIFEKITQTSTFFVEILSPVKLQYSARSSLAMFLVGRFSVPDVPSEKIILFLFGPDPEKNLFVVIMSRSRLHSKRFPVLQLTAKGTLHRPIQHGWTDPHASPLHRQLF